MMSSTNAYCTDSDTALDGPRPETRHLRTRWKYCRNVYMYAAISTILHAILHLHRRQLPQHDVILLQVLLRDVRKRVLVIERILGPQAARPLGDVVARQIIRNEGSVPDAVAGLLFLELRVLSATLRPAPTSIALTELGHFQRPAFAYPFNAAVPSNPLIAWPAAAHPACLRSIPPFFAYATTSFRHPVSSTP